MKTFTSAFRLLGLTALALAFLTPGLDSAHAENSSIQITVKKDSELNEEAMIKRLKKFKNRYLRQSNQSETNTSATTPTRSFKYKPVPTATRPAAPTPSTTTPTTRSFKYQPNTNSPTTTSRSLTIQRSYTPPAENPEPSYRKKPAYTKPSYTRKPNYTPPTTRSATIKPRLKPNQDFSVIVNIGNTRALKRYGYIPQDKVPVYRKMHRPDASSVGEDGPTTHEYKMIHRPDAGNMADGGTMPDDASGYAPDGHSGYQPDGNTGYDDGGSYAGTGYDDGGIIVDPETRIDFPSLLFKYDSTEFVNQREAYARLGKLARSIRELPEQQFLIEGHTCTLGSESHNMRLSYDRAEAVVEFLVAMGVPREQMIPMGQGEREAALDGISKSSGEYALRQYRKVAVFSLAQ